MRFLFVVFFSFSTLFMSGCWWEEETKESITGYQTPKEIFENGMNELEAGQVDNAINIFERLRAAYPASKYAIQSRLETIYALHEKERFDEAIIEADEYIKLFPNHFSSPYAFYLKGISAENKSRSILDNYLTDNAERDISSVKTALEYYLELINKFPKSQYSTEAKDRLVIIRNILARHELVIAIFYTNKNAHIGAINRCKFILEKYPGTPSVPAALHLMAHNYDKINAPKLAEDARRVLQASYPKYIPHYTLKN